MLKGITLDTLSTIDEGRIKAAVDGGDMSDVCVCCHERIEHQPTAGACGCKNFRPCLDWPNAEGWWARSSDGAHVFYESHLDAVFLAGDPHSYSRIAYEYKSRPILDRFTQCEPNPFERK